MTHPAELAPELFNPVRTEHNHTVLYVDGPDCLAMLLEQIEGAQHFINVQTMLFYSDKAGFTIAEALAKKAKQGVTVRVMSDSEMSSIARTLEKYRSEGTSDFSDLKQLFTEAGVLFLSSDDETYSMDTWETKREKLASNGVPEEFLVMQDVIEREVDLNLNVLDHRKLWVFDGVSAVVTSMNIGNRFLYDEMPGKEEENAGKWHDAAILAKGPCASVLNKYFASQWMVRGGDIFDFTKHFRTQEIYGTDACTVFGFFPGLKENPIRLYYLNKIKTCERRFLIENPYINDDVFWKELSHLNEQQACKITIINPYKASGNDYKQNASCIKCHMWEPFKNGVTFYGYSHRMSHLKIALDVAASEVFLGSYNLNHRSALHDFELNLLVESHKLSQKVLELLQQDMAQSNQIKEAEEFYQHPNLHPDCFLLKVTDFFE